MLPSIAEGLAPGCRIQESVEGSPWVEKLGSTSTKVQ